MEPHRSFRWEQQLKIVVGLAGLILLLWFLYSIRGILAPFVLAYLVAYLLSPLVDRMEGRGLNRSLSILLLFAAGLGAVVGGTVFVGGRMTDQVFALGEQLFRHETVERELAIANAGEEPAVVQAVWKEMKPGRRFAVMAPALPLVVEPGARQVIRLRFTPRQSEPAEGVLSITSGSMAAPFDLRVLGNTPPAASDSDSRSFWVDGEYQRECLVPPLLFSVRGLDFGEAGPTLVTRMAEESRKLQPTLGPYLGGLDLEGWVRVQGQALMDTMLHRTTAILGNVFSGLSLVAIVPFVAFFFLKEGRRITRGLIEMVPNAYFELCLNLIYQINGQISGYLRGMLLETGIVAVMSVSALALIGLPYALPIGVLAGLANMIPYLGPMIGIVVASMVALATGGGLDTVSYIVLAFAVIQFVDNMLVQPTVVARSVDLHPLVVLLVVMIGSQLLGMVGMLIAVPLTGVIKVSAQTIYQGIKGYRGGVSS